MDFGQISVTAVYHLKQHLPGYSAGNLLGHNKVCTSIKFACIMACKDHFLHVVFPIFTLIPRYFHFMQMCIYTVYIYFHLIPLYPRASILLLPPRFHLISTSGNIVEGSGPFKLP